MAFYSSKCFYCKELSKRTVFRKKYNDKKGNYHISFYECSNYGCPIALKAAKTKRSAERTNKGS